jgi:hypothetical protein
MRLTALDTLLADNTVIIDQKSSTKFAGLRDKIKQAKIADC